MISEKMFAAAVDRFLSPIEGLMDDGSVSEILINGVESIFFERGGELKEGGGFRLPCSDLRGLVRVVSQYAGRPFDEANPILEARLPDGSRLTAVGEPLVRGEPHVAIRRTSRTRLGLPELVRQRSLLPEDLDLLEELIRSRANILVAGGTGTGKTALLRALTALFEPRERVVVLEDARELELALGHAVSLETRRGVRDGGPLEVTMRDLFRTSLRLRPDRIIMGEIRGPEAMDLILAMTSGHGGCLSTIHSSTPIGALRRLETLALLSGVMLPLDALREQIASAISAVIQVERQASGQRRVTQVVRVDGLEEGTYRLAELSRGHREEELAGAFDGS